MREVSKRRFLQAGGLAALEAALSPAAFAKGALDNWAVPVPLQRRMYAAAIDIARKKIRGGPGDQAFPKPFLDAAFSTNIFLWDTCFIAAYAKYHQDELPIANALDNFYARQDPDGFICREYTKAGLPFWPKTHPVSINPPLLAFAELELYGQSKNPDRLIRTYPKLKRFFDFLVGAYRGDDGLFFSDALGSGMDNIQRYPDGWQDDHEGIPIHNLYPEVFTYSGLNAAWNRQGRSVDFSAQMALFADEFATIARLIGETGDVAGYVQAHTDIGRTVNERCWSEADGFYYDLGYGAQIRRKHIGMFWVMLAGIAPPARLGRMLDHLTDPAQFWRRVPVATWPADQGFFPRRLLLEGQRLGPDQLHDHPWSRALRPARPGHAAGAAILLVRRPGLRSHRDLLGELRPRRPHPRQHSRPDFCGWTGLVPIALYHEFIA